MRAWMFTVTVCFVVLTILLCMTINSMSALQRRAKRDDQLAVDNWRQMSELRREQVELRKQVDLIFDKLVKYDVLLHEHDHKPADMGWLQWGFEQEAKCKCQRK